MDVINKTSIAQNVGIPIEEDNETMIFLVENESLIIHTKESLIEFYKDTNLFDESDDWSSFDQVPEANNFWDVLKIYEEWNREDHGFHSTLGVTWYNDNFKIERIA